MKRQASGVLVGFLLTLGLLAAAVTIGATVPQPTVSAPAPSAPDDLAAIGDVIVVWVDDKPALVTFIFIDGSDFSVPADACAAGPNCSALVFKAIGAGKAHRWDIYTKPDFSKTPGTKV